MRDLELISVCNLLTIGYTADSTNSNEVNMAYINVYNNSHETI